MRFVCYADWGELPASANALFAQGEKESIFLSRAWFENLVAFGLDADQTMLLACVVDGEQVMAILPLAKCAGNTWYALSHRYTPFYSLLLADTDQPQVLDCLARGLAQLPVDSLLLKPVADDDGRVHDLQRAMAAVGFSFYRRFRLYNWIYRVQGESYQDYIASRPARLRNTIARKRRKLEREHGYDIRLFCGDEVPDAMADYYAVYGASWKANEQYTDLVDGMVAGFSGPGWTRLAVLYVAGKPVAAQLWFVLHGKASIFRLAYDEAWKPWSPGSILTAFLMAYVIDTDRVEEIDFLTGNDAYKPDWMSERRERFALSCVKSIKPAGWYEQFVARLKNMFRGR
ncbi:GNAT family N-acetyltransferase [Thiohalophilus sp.]|uniref:GNAT family N-acetyltransferase n=1 Tax=Thiohalophilus sp. TaxID=3028392 RepID=UPI002ACE3F54|nr:GNAT family N-acetyltransferase [Thiohalophilus sp.]MDZ7804021.1 GNAT family N-acetyltransferase [Thiohalophilus sp.]